MFQGAVTPRTIRKISTTIHLFAAAALPLDNDFWLRVFSSSLLSYRKEQLPSR